MFNSLKRGFARILFLVISGYALIHLAEYLPGLFGELGAPLLRGFGLCFVGLGVGDLGLRILQPHVDTAKLVQETLKENNTAAALVYLGRCILAMAVLFLMVTQARAAEMPPNAITYSPLLVSQAKTYWSDMKDLSILASQIEQETCTSLKSKTCWSPLAELKTYREQGVGFGQFTRTFYSDGRIRFDVLTEIVNRNPKDLKGFSWSNWQDPTLQMRAFVLNDKRICNSIKNAQTKMDQYQMCMSAYNGGSAGLSNDRLSCKAKDGCNPNVWFGNVETSGLKSKTTIPGYSQSPFQINRTYVKNIFTVRRDKYLRLDLA